MGVRRIGTHEGDSSTHQRLSSRAPFHIKLGLATHRPFPCSYTFFKVEEEDWEEEEAGSPAAAAAAAALPVAATAGQ